ncbi:MAG: hypothetical protein AAGI71_12460 [Bacteroidota bacterium]
MDTIVGDETPSDALVSSFALAEEMHAFVHEVRHHLQRMTAELDRLSQENERLRAENQRLSQPAPQPVSAVPPLLDEGARALLDRLCTPMAFDDLFETGLALGQDPEETRQHLCHLLRARHVTQRGSLLFKVPA